MAKNRESRNQPSLQDLSSSGLTPGDKSPGLIRQPLRDSDSPGLIRAVKRRVYVVYRWRASNAAA
jgi:hypothetical protein